MCREDLYKSLLKDISGTYVELGTCWGGFAEFLLLNTGVTKLYCVDPYKLFPRDSYFDALNFTTQEQLDQKYKTVVNRLQLNSVKKPVTVFRMTSYQASQELPNSLQFVYIDGNHHHKEVLKDLICWWPKISPGGYLCGDDVEDINEPHIEGDLLIQRPGSFGVYGVATALRDFARVCPDFQYTIVENQFWARKPKKY